MLLLVAAGGLVTSNDAALSIPDWPLSWGRLIPPLEGGIRYEFAHRTLALLVATLVGVQAVWMRRPLAWATFAAVMTQVLVGGAVVKWYDPKSLAIVHACLGQLCFGLAVAVVVDVADWGGRRETVAWAAVAAIYLQTILGAALHHGAMGLASHIGTAAIAVGLVGWASLPVMVQEADDPAQRRAAMGLLVATAVQVFLGVAAYTARAASVDDPQPMPSMVLATVAHVVMGAMALGAGVWLAMGRCGETPRTRQPPRSIS